MRQLPDRAKDWGSAYALRRLRHDGAKAGRAPASGDKGKDEVMDHRQDQARADQTVRETLCENESDQTGDNSDKKGGLQGGSAGLLI